MFTDMYELFLKVFCNLWEALSGMFVWCDEGFMLNVFCCEWLSKMFVNFSENEKMRPTLKCKINETIFGYLCHL